MTVCMKNFSKTIVNKGNYTWEIELNKVYFFNYIKSKCIKKSILYKKNITNILNQCVLKKNLKVKFEGKGYYLYKNIRNTLAPKFGFAHRLYLYHFDSWVKVLSKTKLLFYSNSKQHSLLNAVEICLLRPRNPFTGRGVRLGRSIRFKKRGKVSSFK